MPLLNNHEDDRQGLLSNEEQEDNYENSQTPAILRNDDEAGGFVNDDNDNDQPNFAPATLPEFSYHLQHNEDTESVELLVSNAPPDKFHFSYLVFYLLGTATMTPWNFFVTAEDYWMFKFRNTTANATESEEELTPLQRSFTCDLTLTASISGTTFLILHVIYGHRVSLNCKMLSTLWLILIMFVVTTVFVQLNTDHWQELFFLITLLTVVVINISSATMSGAIFGAAGLFPAKYMTALVSGQALGGIFTALAFISVLAFGATPHTTAFVFFNIGIALMFLSIICYAFMSNQPFFKYFMDGGDKYEIISATPSHSRSADTGIPLEPNLREVFSKIYVHAVGICLLFATTLSVYPSVTVLMQSTDFGNGHPWNDVYYLPVVNYLFFNSGDYLGRVFAGLLDKPRDNAHTALLMAFIRILFVPLFLCSNSNIHNFLPIIVHTDEVFIFLIISFAITNGYLANILLVMAPRSVKQHERETASSIMAAALSCGLACGSLLSMVFVQLL